MDAACSVLRVLERLDDSLVLVELALLDALVDLDNILPDDATRANVQVPATRSATVSHAIDRVTRLQSCP